MDDNGGHSSNSLSCCKDILRNAGPLDEIDERCSAIVFAFWNKVNSLLRAIIACNVYQVYVTTLLVCYPLRLIVRSIDIYIYIQIYI